MHKTRIYLSLALIGAISISVTQRVSAQCTACPSGAVNNGVSITTAAFRINPDGSTGTPLGGGSVGVCQKVRLQFALSYNTDTSLGVNSAFSGGQMYITNLTGTFSNNVTPAGGVPKIGPASEIGPGGCAAGGTNTIKSLTADFDVSAHLADIVAGHITFECEYGPKGTIAYTCPPITNLTSASSPIQIQVAPAPSCSISPPTNTVCSGTSASFTVTPTGQGPFTVSWTGPNGFTSTNTFTITINNAQVANAGVYTATVFDTFGCPSTCTATLIVNPCNAKICVTKEVACYLGTNLIAAPLSISPVTIDEHCGNFSSSATGVSGNTDPAFCYSITISNCGDVNLTNVTVIDNQFGDLTVDFFPGGPQTVFAVSNTLNFIFKATVPQDLTNTVTTIGQSVFNGAFVTNSSQAVVTVVPASVQCTKQYTIDGGPLTNDVTLTDANTHTIVWYVTVRNPSLLVNLGSVVVTDLSKDLPCGPFTVPPFSLPAGGSTNILVCSNSVSCTNGFEGITNSVSVVASDFTLTNGTPVCGIDINNTNIVVTSECSATLLCGQPSACRVTGGGRQDMPNVFPANVRYVTHGGQVGAPVGDRICTVTAQFPIGNPCIHGRWTHVRHFAGGLNGNFHARFYDTLQCACLDTTTTPAVVNLSGVDGAVAQTYTNLVYGPGTTVDTVCNPGNKVAGPEPSPAPANKIVFTGVGDYALTQGNRVPVSVLFRVDIEDRSEPGGSHPKGGTPPPDRNRTRIWILTPTELAELRGGPGDSLLLGFRNAISACNGIDVQDGASVTNGAPAFGVRAPDIDDGGELDRGNYQIHPSILNCDPNNPVGPGLAKP